VYALGGCYKRFEAKVGVDDETSTGSARFRVYADDKPVFDSGAMRKGEPAKDVIVPVDRIVSIRLEVTDGENGSHGAHADWADARLVGDGPPLRFEYVGADPLAPK
jgi:hypothetical protein